MFWILSLVGGTPTTEATFNFAGESPRCLPA